MSVSVKAANQPPATPTVNVETAEGDKTSEVARALIDALALWAHPVRENFSSPTLPLSTRQQSPEERAKPTSSTLKDPSLPKLTSNKEIKERPNSLSTSHAQTAGNKERDVLHVAKETPHSLTSKPSNPLRETKSPQLKSSSPPPGSNLLNTNKSSVSSPMATYQQLKSQKKEPSASKENRLRHLEKEQLPRHISWLNQATSHDKEPRHLLQQQERQSRHSTGSSDGNQEASKNTIDKINTLAKHHFQPSDVDKASSNPLQKFLAEPAHELSQFLDRPVSHFDVLLLFIELMKLEITSQEDEKLSRRAEREMQLMYLEKEVANFQSQSKWLLFSHLGAGLLGILGGIAPILGHTHGDSIIGMIGRIPCFEGIKKKDFFEAASKVLQQTSEVQKAVGQIYTTSAEGHRVRYNRFSDLHRTDHEEMTRSIEQLQERFRQSERFLIELLQMRHDISSQLYR